MYFALERQFVAEKKKCVDNCFYHEHFFKKVFEKGLINDTGF